MKLIKFIPNLFTLANLSLGVVGIYLLLTNQMSDLSIIGYMIMLAAFFDLLDGLLAKLLDARSAIGQQLDSLADLISFGLLPAFIYWYLTQDSSWNYVLLIVPICSAWRLAKFNVSTDQKDSFKGISTTAHGLFVAMLAVIATKPSTQLDELFLIPQNLLIISIFFSLLMISNLRMLSFKMTNFSLALNWDRYAMIIGTTGLIIIFGWSAAPFAMLLYLVLSFFKHFQSQKA